MEARIAPRFRTVQGAGVISHSEKFWLAELILRRSTNFLKMTITAEKPRKSEALRAYVHGGGGEGAVGNKSFAVGCASGVRCRERHIGARGVY